MLAKPLPSIPEKQQTINFFIAISPLHLAAVTHLQMDFHHHLAVAVVVDWSLPLHS